MEFYENSTSGSRVVPSARTDRDTDTHTESHDEAINRFPQLCERARKQTIGLHKYRFESTSLL